jgi:hypothetical protein
MTSWRKIPRSAVTAFKAIASLFFIYHVLAISICVAPANSEVSRQFYPFFKTYLTATGNWQRWLMFHTIPYDNDLEIQAVRSESGREKIDCGYLLPSLDSDCDHIRVIKLAGSIISGPYDFYREPYLKNLGAAVKSVYPETTSYALTVVSHQMQSLQKVRETGDVSNPIRRTYGPYEFEYAG